MSRRSSKRRRMGRPPTNRCTDIAGKVGVTTQYASMVLRGKRMPSLPVASRIARHLGITLDELYKRIVRVQDAATAA